MLALARALGVTRPRARCSASATTSRPSTAPPTWSPCPRPRPTRCPARRSRRRPPAARWSPAPTAGCRRSSATARPAGWSRPATRPRWRARAARAARRPGGARRGSGRPPRADVRERFAPERLLDGGADALRRAAGQPVKPMPFGASPCAAGDRDRADHADDGDHRAADERRPPAAPALAELDDQPARRSGPPIRPPRWPPIEIPLKLSENTRLITSTEPEAALPDRDPAVAGDDDQRAEDRRRSPPRRRPSGASGWNSSAPNEPASSEAK